MSYPDPPATVVLLPTTRVTLNNETNKNGYVMRDLTVQRINSKAKRRLFQLQFTGWPDHGMLRPSLSCF